MQNEIKPSPDLRSSRHLRVLALAAGRLGCHTDLYFVEARELEKAGLIERRDYFSSGGRRTTRWVCRRGA